MSELVKTCYTQKHGLLKKVIISETTEEAGPSCWTDEWKPILPDDEKPDFVCPTTKKEAKAAKKLLKAEAKRHKLEAKKEEKSAKTKRGSKYM